MYVCIHEHEKPTPRQSLDAWRSCLKHLRSQSNRSQSIKLRPITDLKPPSHPPRTTPLSPVPRLLGRERPRPVRLASNPASGCIDERVSTGMPWIWSDPPPKKTWGGQVLYALFGVQILSRSQVEMGTSARCCAIEAPLKRSGRLAQISVLT